MTFDSKILTTLVMLALFAGASLLSLGLPAKAAFMPLLIGIPGVLLCAAQLVLDIRDARATDRRLKADETNPTADAKSEDSGGRSELEMFFWLAVFTALLLGFGFVIGGPIAVLLFVHFEKKNNWLNALFAAAGTFAVLFGIFIWMLELTLFRGFLLEALF
ncbi:MAG: tripartite tricarboxylate transporter TctB family protein [Marinovum algicola]|jgi:hypothetical protein|uniref:tripartite tricarboxylate transporter TctB family protein n=1 Tax=Marinovum algicola TaxID=42444 RepID=UPI0032ED7A4E